MFSWITGNEEEKEPEWAYEDLPSPATDDEFREVAAQTRSQIVPMLGSSEKWEAIEYDENPETKLWQMELEGTAYHPIKCTGVIRGASVEDVCFLFWDAPLEERQKLAPEIIDGGLVRVIDEGTLKVTQAKFGTPIGMSNREFLTVRCRENRDDGSVFIYGRSVNYKDVPFTDGFVRASVLNGHLFEPFQDGDQSGVRMTTVDLVDPKGWVPAAIVNMFKKKPAERLGKIQAKFIKS